MMLSLFRQRYPQGSLVGELVKIDRGIYIVKVSVQVNDLILATALAGADRVEAAEDAARERAIAALVLDSHQSANDSNSTSEVSTVNTSPSTDSPPSEQPTIASVPQESVNNSNIVNFSEPQSEIPARPTTSSDVKSVSSIPESPVPQLIEPDRETVQPIANSGNLFDEAFTKSEEAPSSQDRVSLTGEILENLDSANSEHFTNNLPAETSHVETDLTPGSTDIDAMDFNEIKQKTDIEIRRLGWTKDDGRDFLKSRYGKRSRLHLTDEQLLEFLRYLEKLPTPVK